MDDIPSAGQLFMTLWHCSIASEVGVKPGSRQWEKHRESYAASWGIKWLDYVHLAQTLADVEAKRTADFPSASDEP